MRIIAGKFKSRKLNFISEERTRPTADVVREALFCKIQFDIPNSMFLDLFSGSGSIGLEALSRGAKEVYFIEKDRRNFEIIKNNIKMLYGENYEKSAEEQGQKINLINSDFLTFLDSFSSTIRKEKGSSFDFVYIDPPYNSEFYKIALEKLKNKELIKDESLVICEHEWQSDLFKGENICGCQIISQKKYGIKMLSYLKLKS